MFGNLVGYGDYGFVYEDETEINGPDGSVVKIMNLSNPCNLQQYNMFIQIMNHQDQGIRTPGLPFVFQTFRGIMNTNILNILSYTTTDSEARRRVRTTFPAGTEYGIVNMERLPCIAQNQFCGRNLKDKGNQLEEQSIYEAMVTYLYDSGWWVRDLIDPRNIGYNIHGEPVWFDPMVARRRGFPGFSQQALEQCHEEVVAYPTSYRKAIESGKYFTERHGYGLFNSEDMNAYLFNHRYGWKVEGDIEALNNRSVDFPHAINYAHHNYAPKGFFGLGDLFGAERWDDIEWTTTKPPRSPQEEWIDVEISIFDTEQEYPVYTFSQLSNGLISTNVDTGIDWFFAWNLPPVPLTLQIDTPDGSTITTVYHPQEGDILSALYYALPQEELSP